jgi:hypothetical protein
MDEREEVSAASSLFLFLAPDLLPTNRFKKTHLFPRHSIAELHSDRLA